MKANSILLVAIFWSMVASAQVPAKISRLHYFYNSGWLIETAQHMLVFDFIPHAESNISLATLQQQLLASRSNKRILVFVTHAHDDHFTEAIFDLASRKNVSIILGWQPEKLPNIERLYTLKPGDSLVQRSYSVYTHPATDEGSAFLVKIDGLVIYHAGDHALWAPSILDEFTGQLQSIKRQANKIDLAFLPAARGMFVKCVTDSLIEQGVRLAAGILNPTVIALQHVGCADKLPQYRQTSTRLTGLNNQWILPDRFNQALK